MSRRVLGIVIVSCSCAIAAGAGPATDHGFGVTFLTGYESNPLQQSGDGPGGTLAQLGLDGFYRHEATAVLTLFADGEARSRRHEAAASGADDTAGDVRAGLSVSPVERLEVLFGAEHSLYRATLLDRETGDVYEVDATPIPDRLDHDSTGVFVNARWKQGRRLTFFLDTSLDHVGYAEDYSGATDLEPLDHRSLTLEPGISFVVSDTARVLVSVGLTDLDYDEQSALDSAGERVEGVRRSYRSSSLRARAKLASSARWTFYVGASAAERADTHAGYYDYGSWSGYVSVDRDLGRIGTVRLFASRMDLDYAHATVTGDPAGETRDHEVQRLLARYELDVRKSAGAFVELGSEQADSRDPAYAYDSDWVMAGIRYRR